MEFHEHCMILDGMLSTGEVHELPVDYKGGWFDDKDHSELHGKKSVPVAVEIPIEQVTEQMARKEACRKHHTKQGLKECVKLCIPATCCHISSGTVSIDSCQSQNNVTIYCRHYHDCDALYRP